MKHYYLHIFYLFVLCPTYILSQIVENVVSKKDSLFAIYQYSDAKAKAKAAYDLSVFYKTIGSKRDSSLLYAEKARDLSLKLKDYKLYAYSLKQLGFINLYSDNYDKAELILNEALQVAQDQQELELVAQIKLELGLLFSRQSRKEEAIHYYLDAKEYFEEKEPSTSKHRVYNFLGIFYFQIKEYEKSIEFLLKAKQTAKSIENLDKELATAVNLGNIYGELKEYPKAINIFKEIIFKSNQDSIERKSSKRTSYNNLGIIFYQQKQFDSALFYGNKALKIPTDNFFDSKISRTYNTLGNAHLGLKNYTKAEEYFNKSLQIALKNGRKSMEMYTYEDLYKLFKEKKNYKKALIFYEKNKALEKELSDKDIPLKVSKIESSKVIKEKDLAYASLTKAKEADKQAFKSNIERIFWLGSIFLILFVGVVLLYTFKNKAFIAEKEKQISTMKLFALRSQMNPHFIFNTINGVQNAILKSEKLNAYNHLSKFSQSIRLILNNSNESFVRLQDELDLIKVYVDLEKIRFREKLNFVLKIDPEIEEQNPYIPAMILQPIIENSITHGISNKPERGMVLLKIEPYKNNLKITIEDNGIGRKASQKIKMSQLKVSSGITTVNTKQRIEILVNSGYKETKYYFEDLYDENKQVKGTKSVLILPLKITYDKNN